MNKIIRVIIAIIIIMFVMAFFISPDLFSIFLQRIYWFELFFLILIIWGYGISNIFILWAALVITLLGALLNIFVFNQLSEVVLRIGLVFWIVGLAKTLTNQKRHAKD